MPARGPHKKVPARGPHKKVPVRARSEESIMAKAEGKLIANNKKAYHDYFILEKYEAGIVLHGTEVKSLRMGKCSIKEAFIRVDVYKRQEVLLRML